jgi:hypothetical protein
MARRNRGELTSTQTRKEDSDNKDETGIPATIKAVVDFFTNDTATKIEDRKDRTQDAANPND